MCLVGMPSLEDYWKDPTTDGGLFGNVFIKSRMSKKRWMTIDRNMHPDISFLMASLREKNQKYYYPTVNLSIDETLFLYKGRVRFRQRMPLKPQSTGLKYFVLADANGFIYDAFLYKGKETEEIKLNPDSSVDKRQRGEGQTKDIVQYFIKRLERKGHCIFMDKYYGSESIMDTLLEKGHNGVLACQANRPAALFKNCLSAGFDGARTQEWEWAYRTKGKPILAISFNDKKICNFLSSVDTHLGYTKYTLSFDSQLTLFFQELLSNMERESPNRELFQLLSITTINS